MLTTLYSVLLASACVAVAALSISRPRVGLMFLLVLSPFYSILRESSAGSPLFFLWPYFLTAVVILVITGRELTANLSRRGVHRPARVVGYGAAMMLGVLLLVEEVTVGAARVIVADAGLSSVRTVIENGPLGVATILGALLAMAFFGLFLDAMRRREGTTSLLDVLMVAFVLWGLFQVANTYLRNGLVFTGLNGFRYHFFGALTYFPARYLLDAEGHRRRFVSALALVSIVAGLELYLENVLLNVLALEPEAIPWLSGRLSSEFGFRPDPGRTFFSASYVPLGFMYQSHLSGLFLLLGFALWLPRVLVARTPANLAVAAVTLFFLLANLIWTSRTGLLLGIMVTLLGLAVMRVGWARSTATIAGLVIAAPLVSAYGIPGVKFDLGGQLAYVGGRAVPALFRAVGQDLESITGWNPYVQVTRYRPPWGRPPDGWTLLAGTVRYDEVTVHESDSSVVLRPDGGGAEMRLQTDAVPFRGRTIRTEAWLKADTRNQARVQLHDGLNGSVSDFHSGSGEWEFVIAELDVSAEAVEMSLDVDVEGGESSVFVDSVQVGILENRVTLLGSGADASASALAGLGLIDEPTVAEAAPQAPPPTASDPVAPVEVATAEAGAPGPAGSTAEAPSAPVQRSPWVRLLLGEGATYGDWNVVFFGSSPSGTEFRSASYSDLKVLEFGEQFGAIGVLLLLAGGGIGCWQALRLGWHARDWDRRAYYVGLMLVLFVAYSSLIHLPSLFRVGFSTAAYAMLGIVATATAVSARAGAPTQVVE